MSELECAKSEIDLFSSPFTQTAIEQGTFHKIEPTSGLTNETIDFDIAGDDTHYIDLSETELFLGVRIINKNGEKTLSALVDGANKHVFPANNFMHSLFSSINVKINSTTVEQCSFYPYRAYIEDLLNYNAESKQTFLQNQLFIKYDADRFHEFGLEERQEEPELRLVFGDTIPFGDPTELKFRYSSQNIGEDAKLNERQNRSILIKRKVDALKRNNGACKRRDRIVHSGFMVGKLHLNTFKMNKYLFNNLNVKLTLKKSDKKFCLLQDSDENLFDISYEYIRFIFFYSENS